MATLATISESVSDSTSKVEARIFLLPDILFQEDSLWKLFILNSGIPNLFIISIWVVFSIPEVKMMNIRGTLGPFPLSLASFRY